MAKKQKKNSEGTLFVLVSVLGGAAVGVLIGLFFGRFIGILMSDETSFLKLYLIFLLCILLSFYLQTIIHEAGHLCFGLLSGYRFRSFRIGRILLMRGPDGRLQFKRFFLAGTGGQCLLYPPEPKDGKLPTLLYNLGGVLMNLVSALVFYLLFLAVRRLFPSLFFLTLTLVGLLTALLNGIPMQTKLIATDGHNAWALRKDPAALRSFYLQLKIDALYEQGTPLSDMPEEWFALPSEEELQKPLTSVMAVLAENRMMEQQDLEGAFALADRLLNGGAALIGLNRNQLLCDSAYCALVTSGEAEFSKPLLKLLKLDRHSLPTLRTKYAAALLRDHDEKAAEKALRQFEKIAAHYPQPLAVETERKLMALAGEKARQS